MKLHFIIIGITAAVAAASTSPTRSNNSPASNAFGPPLVCFAYDIGAAQSLPWGPPTEAFECDAKYPSQQLVADTLAILNESKDLVVHMETLRRATVYASRFGDRPLAGDKLTKGPNGLISDRLMLRVLDNSMRIVAKDPNATLAWIDAGYVLGAAFQMGHMGNLDFASYFEKARALAPSDPGAAFAASAAYLDSPNQPKWQENLAAALRTAPEGSLLRKNVVAYGRHYLGKEKFDELLAKTKDKK